MFEPFELIHQFLKMDISMYDNIISGIKGTDIFRVIMSILFFIILISYTIYKKNNNKTSKIIFYSSLFIVIGIIFTGLFQYKKQNEDECNCLEEKSKCYTIGIVEISWIIMLITGTYFIINLYFSNLKNKGDFNNLIDVKSPFNPGIVFITTIIGTFMLVILSSISVSVKIPGNELPPIERFKKCLFNLHPFFKVSENKSEGILKKLFGWNIDKLFGDKDVNLGFWIVVSYTIILFLIMLRYYRHYFSVVFSTHYYIIFIVIAYFLKIIMDLGQYKNFRDPFLLFFKLIFVFILLILFYIVNFNKDGKYPILNSNTRNLIIFFIFSIIIVILNNTKLPEIILGFIKSVDFSRVEDTLEDEFDGEVHLENIIELFNIDTSRLLSNLKGDISKVIMAISFIFISILNSSISLKDISKLKCFFLLLIQTIILLIIAYQHFYSYKQLENDETHLSNDDSKSGKSGIWYIVLLGILFISYFLKSSSFIVFLGFLIFVAMLFFISYHCKYLFDTSKKETACKKYDNNFPWTEFISSIILLLMVIYNFRKYSVFGIFSTFDNSKLIDSNLIDSNLINNTSSIKNIIFLLFIFAIIYYSIQHILNIDETPFKQIKKWNEENPILTHYIKYLLYFIVIFKISGNYRKILIPILLLTFIITYPNLLDYEKVEEYIINSDFSKVRSIPYILMICTAIYVLIGAFLFKSSKNRKINTLYGIGAFTIFVISIFRFTFLQKHTRNEFLEGWPLYWLSIIACFIGTIILMNQYTNQRSNIGSLMIVSFIIAIILLLLSRKSIYGYGDKSNWNNILRYLNTLREYLFNNNDSSKGYNIHRDKLFTIITPIPIIIMILICIKII